MTEVPRAARAPRTRSERILRGLLVSFWTLAALLLLLETLPRVAPIPGLRPAELDPLSAAFKDSRIEPHPYLAYALRPDFHKDPAGAPSWLDPQIRHNSLGFRGRETTWDKPEGTFRILCLGGSSTYGIGPSTDESNWTSRLEVHLNDAKPAKPVEVINAGCQGYSSFEMLIQLELRGVDFRPDLVLCYETINDMRCALYPGVRRDNSHWRANWPVGRTLPLEASLGKSITYQAWRRYCTDWWRGSQDLLNWVVVDATKNMERYGDHYAQPTDAERGYVNFQRNLVSIIGVAHAHGAEVMLVTQATRMSDFDRAAKSGAMQRKAFDDMVQIVRRTADERSVPLCDARPVLEAEADRQRAAKIAAGEKPPEGRPEPLDDVFTNEVHMTDAGCELLARTIAARILELKLVK